MAGKDPDALAKAFKAAAEKAAREKLAKTQKALTAEQRARLSRDTDFTSKRLRAENN